MDNINNKFNYEAMKSFLKRRWLYIFLPILYFIYKKIVLIPYGDYISYNKVTFSGIVNTLPIMEKTFKIISIDLFIYITNNYILTSIVCMLSLIFIFVVNIKIRLFKDNRQILIIIILAIILFILAIFPYATVGKVTAISGWNNRFSLLLGISISLIYMAVIALFNKIFYNKNNKVFLFFVSTLIMLFISKNVIVQYKQNIDWFYQSGIIENFKKSNIIKNNTTFVAINQLNGKLIYNRVFRVYELTGMLKATYGNEKRLMALNINQLKYYAKNYKNDSSHNFTQWQYNNKIIYVYFMINKDFVVTNRIIAKLFYYRIFNKQKYKELVKNLVQLSYYIDSKSYNL
jgi:hypothetical protein